MFQRMIAVFAVALLASPVHAKLEIKKVQAAYGPFGTSRGLNVVPGEELIIRFQATGVAANAEGLTDLSMTVTLLDKDGKSVAMETTPIKAGLNLGGGELPGLARLSIGNGATPGDYTMKVKLEDKLSNESAEFERKVTVQSPKFALINPRFFYDANGIVSAPTGGMAGQSLFFRCQVVGVEPTERLALSLTMRVVDLDKKDVLNPPSILKVQENDLNRLKKLSGIAFDRSLLLSRPGEYVLIVKVVDEMSKKEATFESPLVVTAP